MPRSTRGRASSTRAAPTAHNHPNQSNGIERQRVTNIQRTRMLAAMAEACTEHGAANVTVAHVVERAGVSRRTFYEIFTDIDGCFLAALDEAVESAAAAVLPAYHASARWHERMRASLSALLLFIDEGRPAGRLLVVEMLGAGRCALERRSRILAHAIAAVEEGAGEPKAASGVSRLTAEGVVGAVLSVLHGRLLDGAAEPLIEFLNPLMSMVVLPYLGPAAARRELNRPPVSADSRRRASAANPLKELRMRLTYRTVRVLSAVAAHPGASNKAIGDASEIADQGQISKLLSRLERLGLIENAGAAAARGEPNAWTLTQCGWQVHASLLERAASG